MSVKIVTYDLRKQWQDYRDFINAIKAYDSVKMTDSFWYVNTEDDCENIYRNLEIYMEKDDRLLIQDLKGEVIVGNNLLSSEEKLQSLFK
jgi:hypothetical protein